MEKESKKGKRRERGKNMERKPEIVNLFLTEIILLKLQILSPRSMYVGMPMKKLHIMSRIHEPPETHL